MKITLLATVAIIFILSAYSPDTQSENPAFVVALIKQFESDPVGNPPQSIWSYDYSGQTVYFIPAQCCDQYSTLMDATGSVICAPDGGLTGKGDGKCPDFFTKRSNEHLIWKDSRTR